MVSNKLSLIEESFLDGHLKNDDLAYKWDIKCLFNVTNEEWMVHYKNADFIITDSIHGMCFAIIHKKQFFVLVNNWRGKERFLSLATLLGLEDRMIYKPYNFDMS